MSQLHQSMIVSFLGGFSCCLFVFLFLYLDMREKSKKYIRFLEEEAHRWGGLYQQKITKYPKGLPPPLPLVHFSTIPYEDRIKFEARLYGVKTLMKDYSKPKQHANNQQEAAKAPLDTGAKAV